MTSPSPSTGAGTASTEEPQAARPPPSAPVSETPSRSQEQAAQSHSNLPPPPTPATHAHSAPPPPPTAGVAHGIPVSPLRQSNTIPQNRLSPYLPGAARERASSSSSLDRRAIAASGPGVLGGGYRSFGHSHSSPVTSPLGGPFGGRARVVPGVGGAGAVVMPMIPNLTPGQHLPVTPPCTPIGAPAKICGASLAAAASSGPMGVAPASPSVMRARQKAMENAAEAERARARELEEREKSMDVDQLRVQLKRERAHSARLAADLAGMWSASGLSQAEAEVYEEGRINNLMRRLDRLQREKGRIILELEREEEMLTNTLQKKLNEVRREKALLEQQIEREHEENARLKRQQQEQEQQHAEDSMEENKEKEK